MKLNKLTGYFGVALISAGVTFGVSWFVFDYMRRDVIKLGEEMSIVFDCVDMMKEGKYPMNVGNPVKAAIQGYLSEYSSDKYTFYNISEGPEDEMTTYVNTSGTAVASGFRISRADDGNILLTEIIEGLAADKQGLRAGDEISKIGGVSVKEKGYENIANKLLGKQDTEVELTILRDGEDFTMTFVRDHKYINMCDFEGKGDVAYIRLSYFDALSQGQFNQALTKSEEFDKIIFDLRSNPGGPTDVGVYIAAEACGECKVVKHAYTGEDEVIERSYDSVIVDKRVVVLINEKTASSAEIFVAALKQKLDPILVGVNTLGKGVYQEVHLLDNGDQFQFTAGTYTVGDWECYQGVGIAPDVEVPMDRELIGTDEDIQLKKALELLD